MVLPPMRRIVRETRGVAALLTTRVWTFILRGIIYT
jgi:hypothetical protein